MKWFKHQCNARNDERIAHLEQLAGLEGYGFYIKLLEIVAESMDGTDKCSLTYPLTTWSHQLYIHHNKVSKLLGKCEVAGLVSVKYHECNGNVRIEVVIPNLLKYRDNHTKNLQVTYKQEVEVEVEVEQKEREKKKVHQTTDKSVIPIQFALPDWIDKTQWDLWIKSRKKKMIPEQMQAQIDKLSQWRNEGLDHCGALANSALNGYAGLFLPDAKKSLASKESDKQQVKAAAYKRLFGGVENETV